MNNYIKFAILIVVGVLIVWLVPFSKPSDDGQQAVQVTDFLTCSEAGYQVMETFPAQCKGPDGKIYVEDISEQVEVVIASPARDAVVKGPLTVTGKAKGNWFFEANIPVSIYDSTDKLLATKGAQAKGEWMTTDFVDFEVTLDFQQPTTDTGYILVEKDNPSGMPENAGRYAIPVRFR